MFRPLLCEHTFKHYFEVNTKADFWIRPVQMLVIDIYKEKREVCILANLKKKKKICLLDFWLTAEWEGDSFPRIHLNTIKSLSCNWLNILSEMLISSKKGLWIFHTKTCHRFGTSFFLHILFYIDTQTLYFQSLIHYFFPSATFHCIPTLDCSPPFTWTFMVEIWESFQTIFFLHSPHANISMSVLSSLNLF